MAAGRNPAVLRMLPSLGADAVVSIAGPDAQVTEALAAEHAAHPFDVVLDYLWGHPAELTLAVLTGRGSAEKVPRLRFVSIGAIAGATAVVLSAPLRSTGLELLGSGIGSVPEHDVQETIPKIFDLAATGRLPISTKTVPLSRVGHVWSQPEADGHRVVLTP